MKKLLFLVVIYISFIACDAPQRTRLQQVRDNENNLTSGNNTSNDFTAGTTGSSSNGSNLSSPSTSGPGFENCDLTNRYHTIDIGHFGLCQNTQDETLFKFKTSLTSGTVCLIPTYKDSTGSSTYLGRPQCVNTEANKVFQGTLYKDRNGFSGHVLNGVIVMKQNLLTPYFDCMNAYVNWPAQTCPQGPSTSLNCYSWIQQCPYGARTNINCDTQAKSYMAQICNSFKSTFSNSYADIRTK